jgi:hypothetical protein
MGNLKDGVLMKPRSQYLGKKEPPTASMLECLLATMAKTLKVALVVDAVDDESCCLFASAAPEDHDECVLHKSP